MAEKKKWKLKFNLFDLAVVLLALIIAVVAVIYVRGKNPSGDADDPGSQSTAQTVRYTLEIEQAYEEVAEMAQVGDKLYERTKKQYLGTVESLEILPTTVLTRDNINGEIIYVDVPERKNIKMQVVAQGVKTKESITLDSGIEIRAGDNFRVCGPGYYGAGYATHVERS